MTSSETSRSSSSKSSIDSTNNLIHQPRLGLGSTDSENIALRRNIRERELLRRKQKNLTLEQHYTEKLIDLNFKSIQVKYKRLTKRVSRIQSHLTDDEIKELENDTRKKEFADKYRKLICDKDGEDVEGQENDSQTNVEKRVTFSNEKSLENEVDKTSENSNSEERSLYRSNTTLESSVCNPPAIKERPKTTPYMGTASKKSEKTASDTLREDIIPSLEDLLDQLHNIKPQQFYENQRKLKLYDIQLLQDELEARKDDLYKAINNIINWDKKDEKEEKPEEKEKPKRKTKFMRSILRNFSMELMAKSMQYGWADMGQCRYLRGKNVDSEASTSGLNTLAKDTMKIKLDSGNENPESEGVTNIPKHPPGFDENGKLIRTADLLGLKE